MLGRDLGLSWHCPVPEHAPVLSCPASPLIGAIWLGRFQPTLNEPAPVSHSVIRGQDEPGQQPNQRGRG